MHATTVLILIVLPLAFSFTCDEIIPNLCPLTQQEGTLQVRNKPLKYWIYSSPASSLSNNALPLITVHGGPAFCHNYMLPLKQIACQGRMVVFYDQMGCGGSWRPEGRVSEEAPWLLTMEYYEEELDALVTHLGFEKFHLLGSSWGGILIQNYALSFGHKLKSLVLASSLSDAKLYIRSQQQHRHTTLPPVMQRFLIQVELEKDYENPIYQQLSNHLLGYWTCRTFPLPDCVIASLQAINTEIYFIMQGPSEFSMSGVLEYYNVTAELHRITCPTLVTVGKYDTMTMEVVETIAKNIPNSELKVYPHSGHLTMIDDVEMFNVDVNNFLEKVENPLSKIEL